MSNEKEITIRTSSGRFLMWLAIAAGTIILTLCLWLLLKPGTALGVKDRISISEIDNNPPLVLPDDYSFLAGADSHPPLAGTDVNQSLDCLACHKKVLTYHDKLGSGNQACYTCHDSADITMKNYRLANDTVIQKIDSSQLCGQCHQTRYTAWSEGTHGIPGTIAAAPCVACHNPHEPQVVFRNITKPPMPPVNTAPSLPTDWLIILIISIVFLIGMGLLTFRRRESL